MLGLMGRNNPSMADLTESEEERRYRKWRRCKHSDSGSSNPPTNFASSSPPLPLLLPSLYPLPLFFSLDAQPSHQPNTLLTEGTIPSTSNCNGVFRSPQCFPLFIQVHLLLLLRRLPAAHPPFRRISTPPEKLHCSI